MKSAVDGWLVSVVGTNLAEQLGRAHGIVLA